MDEIKLFNEAFNKGYLLRKSDPDLTKSIISGFLDPFHPYTEGFVSGVAEQEREQKQQLDQFLESEKKRQIDKGGENKELEQDEERDLKR